MKKLGFTLIGLLVTSLASAQSVSIRATDTSTGAATDVGDASNAALRTTIITMPSVSISGTPTVDTELPAAAALANGAANPTAPAVGAFNLIYNGSTWDRWTGAVTANAGTNLNTSALALDATVTGRLPAGGSPANGETNTNTNLSRIGGYNFIFNGTTWDRWTGAVSITGTPTVSISGTPTVQPGNTANTTPWLFTINQGGNSATVSASNALKVDGSAVTQPISAVSLPLPSLAATSTKQSDGTQKTQIVDGSGNVIASTSNNLNVQCANCSGSGASAADEATFTAAASTFAPGGGFFQTTATNNALTTGQQGMWQMTANRAGFINLRNASGTELGVAAAPLQVSLANTGANATAVKVDGSAVTQPVSGTITANIGTTNGLALDTSVNGLLLSQASTTSGQKGPLAQGAVTTGNPSYTTAQTSPLSLDLNGGLRVSIISGAGSGGTALADRASFTYGATSFTPSGGVYNSSITALTSGQAGVLALDSFRTAHVGLYDATGAVIAPSVDAVDNTAVPGSGPQMFGYASAATPSAVGADGRAKSIWLDTVGRQHIVCDSGCSATTLGQATKANSLPVTLAFDQGAINVNNMLIGGQPIATGVGFGTSGTQRVALSFDSKVRVEPGYNALNVNLAQYTPVSGRLPVDGSGVTQPVSGTITANAGSGTFTVSGSVTANAGTNLNTSLLAVEAGGNLAAVRTAVETLDNIVSGAGVNISQFGGANVVTVAAGVPKVGIADSAGAAFLSAANALNSTGSGISASQLVGQFDDVAPTAITENQFGNLRMSGNRNLYGTLRDAAGNERGANVTAANELLVSVNNASLAVTQGTAANLNATVVQGNAGSNAQAWWTRIGDATNGPVAVKAASTAAGATDPALVVAISPNNTVAVTQSTSPWVTGISQFGGSNVVTGTGGSGAGIPRVTVSNDSVVLSSQNGSWTIGQGAAAILSGAWPMKLTDGVTSVAVRPDGSQQVYCTNCQGVTVQTGGLRQTTLGLKLYGSVGQPLGDVNPLKIVDVSPVDPCLDLKRVDSVALSQTSNTQVVPGQPGKVIAICHYLVVGSDAEGVSFAEGVGATCGTSTLPVIGGSTAANGMPFAANGGTNGNAGPTWSAWTHVIGNNLCLLQSGAGRVAGSLKYAYIDR